MAYEKGEILKDSITDKVQEIWNHRITFVPKIENMNKIKTEYSEQNNTVCSQKIMTHMGQTW